MARVLIGGTAALLICIFLSRSSSSSCADASSASTSARTARRAILKAGTPTMGGIIMLIAVVVPFLILTTDESRSVGVFGAMIACALLGLRRRLHEDRQAPLAGASRSHEAGRDARDLDRPVVVRRTTRLAPDLRLRFVDYQVDLGVFYPFLIYFVVAGTTSGVNLTDGLDGLAAGCAAIVLMAYMGIASSLGGSTDLELPARRCLVGSCIGFLWFNAFPATIFMGDTARSGSAARSPGSRDDADRALLILLGGIFVIEALSVLIQIVAFQMFRKRVFLMAPIHHHFELKAWSETKIILRFWIVAAIGAGSASRSTRDSMR